MKDSHVEFSSHKTFSTKLPANADFSCAQPNQKMLTDCDRIQEFFLQKITNKQVILHKNIIGDYSQDYGLASHTTHVLGVLFMRE